ncbi:cytochrome P450 [Tsukamurella soli]|uniref:cytochrome P450 n=1 Tax=Tsukamurella soli TaxID=644556 RepID=UPI00360A65EC
MQPRIDALVTELVDRIAADGVREVDVVERLAYPLPVGVICELLGVPRSEEPVFHSFAERLTRGLDPDDTLSETEIADLAVTRAQWRAYLMPMIAERAANPGDDLVSALLVGGDPDTRMNALELGVTLGLLLIAGHETTVNLVANGTLALLRNPLALTAFRAHPETAPALVEEVLRYDPPVQMTRRFATAPVRVAGVDVSTGDRLALLLAAGNRDPRHFAEPDSFAPGRPDPAHLAFSGGLHYCLGAALARMEAQAMLTAIAGRLVCPRLVADPPYRTNMTLRGPSSLRVAFDEVQPAAHAT